MGEHAYAHVPVMAGRVTALLLPALTGPTPDDRPPVLGHRPARHGPARLSGRLPGGVSLRAFARGHRLAPGKWRQPAGRAQARDPPDCR